MIRFNKLVTTAAIAASTLIGAGTASAQGVTSAVKPVSFGISGGAAIPTGDLSDAVNTGYAIDGHIALGFTGSPLSLRGDVGYNSWNYKDNSGNFHAFHVVGNGILSIPMQSMIHPYLLAGVGGFKAGTSADLGGGTTATTTNTDWNLGFNLGGGITLPLGGLNAFVEAKYTQINGKNGASNAQFVPITFGVMF